MPEGCSRAVLPTAPRSGGAEATSLPEILAEGGFDASLHEQIRADLQSGRLGWRPTACRREVEIRDVDDHQVVDTRGADDEDAARLGREAIAGGTVAVVTLAAGVGSRWTQGAGVCKALHPFAKFDGRHRRFLEVHLAKTRRTMAKFSAIVPHVLTTSWMTQAPIESAVRDMGERHPGPLHVSPGRSVGLRMVPTVADLQFLWEETAQQALGRSAGEGPQQRPSSNPAVGSFGRRGVRLCR